MFNSMLRITTALNMAKSGAWYPSELELPVISSCPYFSVFSLSSQELLCVYSNSIVPLLSAKKSILLLWSSTEKEYKIYIVLKLFKEGCQKLDHLRVNHE